MTKVTVETDSSREYRYEAFISYRHVNPDMAVAMELHKALERFTIPAAIRSEASKKAIGRVFRDQEELPTSADLGNDIEEALRNSKWLIVVCSPRLLESVWCMREVNTFIELGRRDHILTVLAEGEPRNSFPPQLRFMNVDGKEVEIEPLAADVRAENQQGMIKRLKKEKFRLLAPILGVSFDDLFQRAKKRARKRAFTVCACAMAALAVFGGILGYQAIQTQQANKLAAAMEITKLFTQSESGVRAFEQNSAVDTAKKALELAQQYHLYEQEATSVLYRAVANFPSDGAYATLKHNAGIGDAVFSATGELIAVLTADAKITVWDTRYAVKKYEVALDPFVFNAENIMGGVVELKMNGCAFCFNGNDELFVLDVINETFAKYGADGTEIFTRPADFGRGVDFVTYTQGTFELLRPRMVYSKEADAIVINYYDLLPDVTAFISDDVYLAAYDAGSGEKIYEYETGLEQSYPMAIQPGADGNIAVIMHMNPNMRAVILTKEVMRNGETPVEVSLAGLRTWYQFLFGNYFLTLSNGEFHVLNGETMETYAVPGIAPPKEETDKAVLMAGQKSGEFYAGFVSSLINYYSFDGNAVTLIRTEVDVDRDTGFSGWIAAFGWADIEEGTVAFICDQISTTACRLVMRDGLYHHDYQYDFMLGTPYYSEHGFYAEMDSNIVKLYNLSIFNSEFSRSALAPRNQPGMPYMDEKKGLLVSENADEDGFFFEISSFDNARVEPLCKAYLPNTKGYSPMKDACPYESIFYAKDCIVILTAAGEDHWQLHALHYGDGKLVSSEKWEGNYPRIVAVNGMGIIIGCGHTDVKVFDAANPANVIEIPSSDLFSKEWLDEKVPFGQNTGPAVRNIILWPYVDKTMEEQQVMLGYLDIEARAFIESDMRYDNDVNSPAVWSESGKNTFVLDTYLQFGGYNMEKMEKLPREIFPEDIASIKDLGGNVLAFISKENAVAFYDMDSLKKLCEVPGETESVRFISYNMNNGLAVVSRRSTVSIYNLETGERHAAPITLAATSDLERIPAIYISNDAKSMLDCFIRVKTGSDGIKWNWCTYTLRDLLSAQELLAVAQKYEGT